MYHLSIQQTGVTGIVGTRFRGGLGLLGGRRCGWLIGAAPERKTHGGTNASDQSQYPANPGGRQNLHDDSGTLAANCSRQPAAASSYQLYKGFFCPLNDAVFG
jgi:hypothetical protein